MSKSVLSSDNVLRSIIQKDGVDKESLAYVTMFIGPRKVLIREMNRDGEWVCNTNFELAK